MIAVPVLPNAPVARVNDEQRIGSIDLRRNMRTDLVENGGFSVTLITYDGYYKNDQPGSDRFRSSLLNMTTYYALVMRKALR